MKILVTGATGNVGREVTRFLAQSEHEVVVGTRSGASIEGSNARAVMVDFEASATLTESFDAIFLVRPPQLADSALFARFLEPHDRKTLIIFLSVQGADKKSYLPHAKIERQIVNMGFPHVFIRPSYFMDNLLTTLWPELAQRQRIYLPAGGLALDWVSARDVAEVSAAALTGKVPTPAINVCSGEKTGFHAVCKTINRVAGTNVVYKPAGVLRYVIYARKTGAKWLYIMVMLLLHFLPRFEKSSPQICEDMVNTLHRKPETLAAFVLRNRSRFAALKPH